MIEKKTIKSFDELQMQIWGEKLRLQDDITKPVKFSIMEIKYTNGKHEIIPLFTYCAVFFDFVREKKQCVTVILDETQVKIICSLMNNHQFKSDEALLSFEWEKVEKEINGKSIENQTNWPDWGFSRHLADYEGEKTEYYSQNKQDTQNIANAITALKALFPKREFEFERDVLSSEWKSYDTFNL